MAKCKSSDALLYNFDLRHTYFNENYMYMKTIWKDTFSIFAVYFTTLQAHIIIELALT